MTGPDPQPLTDDELAGARRWRDWPGEPVDTGVLLDRALAAVIDARAERDALRTVLSELFDIFIEGGYAEAEDVALLDRISTALAAHIPHKGPGDEWGTTTWTARDNTSEDDQ